MDLNALTSSIEIGDRVTAAALARDALDEGRPADQVLDAMMAAMNNVGGRFQRGEIYVPEMLIAARAMKEATAIVEPTLAGAGIRPVATAVIGTVKGDLHDIGKNLVGMLWRGANIEVVDLGTNVTPELFAAAAREHGALAVGVSALLTTTMVGMRDVVVAVRDAGLDKTAVVVGGAPVTAEFASEIGADGYAPDAGAAADWIRHLVAGQLAD